MAAGSAELAGDSSVEDSANEPVRFYQDRLNRIFRLYIDLGHSVTRLLSALAGSVPREDSANELVYDCNQVFCLKDVKKEFPFGRVIPKAFSKRIQPMHN